MLPILNLGPLAIQVPGLVLLIGLWLGLSLSERYAPSFGVKPNQLYNLVFVMLISGIIGARLAYILRYPGAFADNLASIFSINISLLDPWGGLALATVAALIYGQRKEMSFLPTVDALTPLLAVMSISISLSQLASGSGFGAPTNLPWGIELWGTSRHPTQIYGLIGAIVVLAYLWPGRESSSTKLSGRYFLTFVIYSSAMRLFLEGFRGDSVLLPGGFRLIQIVTWVVLAISLWYLHRFNYHQPDKTERPTTA